MHDRYEEAGKNHLTENQEFLRRQTTSQRPLPKILRIYISWYINDYGQPWASSDSNSKIWLDHRPMCTSWWVLHPTTDLMVNRRL
jgi:hypothetical protein